MSPAAAAAKELEARGLPDWKLAYRVPEAAAATGIGESTIWKRIKAGKISPKRDNGLTLITRAELLRYLDSLST